MFGDRAYLCHIKQVASAPVPQSISAEALKSESRAPADRAPRQRWHFFSNHTDRIDGATDGESLCVCVLPVEPAIYSPLDDVIIAIIPRDCTLMLPIALGSLRWQHLEAAAA